MYLSSLLNLCRFRKEQWLAIEELKKTQSKSLWLWYFGEEGKEWRKIKGLKKHA